MADQETEGTKENLEQREGDLGMDIEESPVRPDRQPNSLTPDKEELADLEPGQGSRPEGIPEEEDAAKQDN